MQGGLDHMDRAIKWNFTKFVVDKAGQPVARCRPFLVPEKVLKSILLRSDFTGCGQVWRYPAPTLLRFVLVVHWRRSIFIWDYVCF